MSIFIKSMKWITRVCMYVCYAAMLALLAITVYDVIMRYVFNNPSSGVTEWSQMLLITGMLCMANACAEGRFIAVGVLVDRFPKKANAAVEIAMVAAAIVFFIIVGYQLILLSQLADQMNEAYFVIKTQKWPMYLILGISFLTCVFAAIIYVIERLKKLFSAQAEVEEDILDNPELAILLGKDVEDKEGGVA